MKRLFSTRLLGLWLAAVVGITALPLAHAQAPVRFLVPLGPGSGGDTLTRLAAKLAVPELGRATFADNKPGGDTVIAVRELWNAPADGNTVIMLSPTPLVTNPLIAENLPYDAQRDLRPLVGMIRTTAVLVTASGSRFNSLAEVLAAARKAPRSVSMANYSQHYRLGGLMLQKTAKVEFNHVPYKTSATAVNDLIGGAVDVALMDVGAVLPLISSGKLKALASTGKERHSKLPDVPTMREGGIDNYELYAWICLGVAAGTPEPIVQALEAALLKAVRQPEFAAYATQTAGAELYAITGKELAAMISSEIARYRPFAKQLAAMDR